jgi:hypothetical protein
MRKDNKLCREEILEPVVVDGRVVNQAAKGLVEIQQVTPDEVRIGIGYGAMFSSVYNPPVRVWPQRKEGKNNL